MSREKLTVGELLAKFDNYKRLTDGSAVLIHPNIPFGFLEVTPEFLNRLKTELELKLGMIVMGADEPDALTQLAIMVLENSY